MRRGNGASLAGASTPSEARKLGQAQCRVSSRTQNQLQAAHYSVTDGRTPLGVVEQVGNSFVAVTTDGTVIGEFATLREAEVQTELRQRIHDAVKADPARRWDAVMREIVEENARGAKGDA